MDSSVRISARERIAELNVFAGESQLLKTWKPVDYIGKGAYARVFRVENIETGRVGALKFIPSPFEREDCRVKGSPDDYENAQNFAASRREAEIMMRFHGESCIVQYLEKPEYLEHGFVNGRGERVVQYAVLICMPLYINSDQWMAAVAGNREACLRLGVDITSALTVFEKKGVYHRDIKPENILMKPDGHFCLSDVGEAKLESENTTMGFHGTRAYMAPEVYSLVEGSKHHSDHRSDIYSLGIVLYRLFNRQQFPFLAEDGSLTADARRNYRRYEKEMPKRSDRECANRLRYGGVRLPNPSEADEALSKIILKACAYRAENRYQGAAEMYATLRQYSVYGSDEQSTMTVRMCPSAMENVRTERKKNIAPYVAASLLVALAAGGALLVFNPIEKKESIEIDSKQQFSLTREDVPNTPETGAASPSRQANEEDAMLPVATASPSPTPTLTTTPTLEPTSETGSAQISTPTSSPSPVLIVTPTPSPTPTPTVTPTLSPTPTPTVTPTPSPTPVPAPTPEIIEALLNAYQLGRGDYASLQSGQSIKVYSGPGTNYYRPGNGKAVVGTSGDDAWVLCYGHEDDWYLIEYEISKGGHRFGYIHESDISGRYSMNETPLLNLARSVRITGRTQLTDDPNANRAELATLNEGSYATLLFFYGNWAYIEVNNGNLIRGFVPSDMVSLQ